MKTNFWDERYGVEEYAYGTEPNKYFKEFLQQHDPGVLLLPGEGEGRNAVYAALQGWQVEAVDMSIQGQKKAIKLASERNVRIRYFVDDITRYDFGRDRFDAVASIFLHLPEEERISLHHRLIESLKPGGWIMIEAFSKGQAGKTSGGPRTVETLFNEEMLAEDFKQLEIRELYSTTGILDEGPYHKGEAALVRLTGRKKE